MYLKVLRGKSIIGKDTTVTQKKHQESYKNKMENFTFYTSLMEHLSLEDFEQIAWLVGIDNKDTLHALNTTDDNGATAIYTIQNNLTLYLPILILFFGYAGNILSLFVLSQKSMRKLSIHLYLMVLAIVDISVLTIGLLPVWFDALLVVGFQNWSPWVCKISAFIGYTTSDFATWLIVAISIERYMVIRFPLKAKVISRRSTAKRVIGGIFIVLCIVNLHLLWTVDARLYTDQLGKEYSICTSDCHFESFMDTIWPWLDIVFYSVGPILCTVVANCMIIYNLLFKLSKQGLRRNESIKRTSFRRKSYNMTLLLLLVSFTFVATTLPLTVINICTGFFQKWQLDSVDTAKVHLARTVAELLMYTNHGISFFLYCISGEHFRSEFMKVLRNNFGESDRKRKYALVILSKN